jgi:hypothetical protein
MKPTPAGGADKAPAMSESWQAQIAEILRLQTELDDARCWPGDSKLEIIQQLSGTLNAARDQLRAVQSDSWEQEQVAEILRLQAELDEARRPWDAAGEKPRDGALENIRKLTETLKAKRGELRARCPEAEFLFQKRKKGEQKKAAKGREIIYEKKVLAARAFQKELGLVGIFAMHKPVNWSSFDMVCKVRNTLQRVFKEKHPDFKLKHGQLKVGHGGTLDPLATGVMVIFVGRRATRLMDDYAAGSKVYEAVFRLGFETTSGDLEGESIGGSKEWAHVTEDMVRKASHELIGTVLQVPPTYSVCPWGH